MVYVHTILRDVAGLFKVGRLVAYEGRSHFTKQTDPIRPESGKRKVCTKQAVFRALLKMRGGRLCREESDSPCQT